MKQTINALIFATAIIFASIALGYAYQQRTAKKGKIMVTGLGSKDFSSDLIVWSGRFEVVNTNIKTAYAELEKQKQLIKTYLLNKGVKDSELVFQAVQTNEKTQPIYNSSGNYSGNEFVGYQLSQRIKVESKDVKKTEIISREITELLNSGVQLYSEAPRYYYTQLADLKIEMISRATEDARIRAEQIAKNSGGKLGKLISAKMGVFQITGQNSNEDYSWGGTYNTQSKNKTASITMKLEYESK